MRGRTLYISFFILGLAGVVSVGCDSKPQAKKSGAANADLNAAVNTGTMEPQPTATPFVEEEPAFDAESDSTTFACQTTTTKSVKPGSDVTLSWKNAGTDTLEFSVEDENGEVTEGAETYEAIYTAPSSFSFEETVEVTATKGSKTAICKVKLVDSSTYIDDSESDVEGSTTVSSTPEPTATQDCTVLKGKEKTQCKRNAKKAKKGK